MIKHSTQSSVIKHLLNTYFVPEMMENNDSQQALSFTMIRAYGSK
jgi:hypothetical protein